MERRVLAVSVLFALIFALFGIIYGIISGSTMIIFDGVYSTISVLLSLLSIAILKEVDKGTENETFPFGKWHFEPALVVFKSLVIVSLCIYSISNGISDLFSGGNAVNIGLTIIYSVISFALCALVFWYIETKNRKVHSELLTAESTQWMGDTLLSLGVLVGFGITYLFIGTKFEYLVPYTDPFMVVVASAMFLFFPIKSLIKNFGQLIFYKADDALVRKSRMIIKDIAQDIDASYKIHLVKIGRELFMEVNFLTEKQSFSVGQMDEIRNRIDKEMEHALWLNITFTAEPKWL